MIGYNPNNLVQVRAKAAETRAIVLAVVGFYQSQYAMLKIAPGGARWRELRFSFPRYAKESIHGVTVDDLWDYLYYLVNAGCIKEYQTIFRPRYEIDYTALHAFQKKWNLT